jgi:hypothetical protein
MMLLLFGEIRYILLANVAQGNSLAKLPHLFVTITNALVDSAALLKLSPVDIRIYSHGFFPFAS